MAIKGIFLATLAATVAIGACTPTRDQISNSLGRYGLSSGQATCAAEFLQGKLSAGQWGRLADAARYYRSRDTLTFGDLVQVAARLRDPEIALQVGATALACGIAADVPVPGL